MARLIVNADDLGIHPDINRGIKEAYENGVLTSATMLLTTPYLQSSIDDVIGPTDIPTGVHLSLTLGWPVSPPDRVGLLVDDKGEFNISAEKLFLLGSPDTNPKLFGQIRIELEAQLRLARDTGVPFTHLDSHQNFHMNPHLFGIIDGLAPEYGFTKIRMCRERFHPFTLANGFAGLIINKNIVKWALVQRNTRKIRSRLQSPDRFFGVMYTGMMTRKVVTSFIESLQGREGTYELALHPGFAAPRDCSTFNNGRFNAYISSEMRDSERLILTDEGVRRSVEENGVELISYRDIQNS